jgi:hypothetical protein
MTREQKVKTVESLMMERARARWGMVIREGVAMRNVLSVELLDIALMNVQEGRSAIIVEILVTNPMCAKRSQLVSIVVKWVIRVRHARNLRRSEGKYLL